MIEPLNKDLNENNYIEIDMRKVKFLVTLDRSNYSRIEGFYMNTIYKKKELKETMERLRNIIINIERKNHPIKSVYNFISNKKTFKDYKVIDVTKSISDLDKENTHSRKIVKTM